MYSNNISYYIKWVIISWTLSHNMLRMCEGNWVSFQVDLKLTTAVDVNKCTKHIILPISLTRAHRDTICHYISTMMLPVFFRDQLQGDVLAGRLLHGDRRQPLASRHSLFV